MCCGFCCKKKKSDDDDDEDEDEDEDNKPKDKYTWGQKWVPTIFYFVFFVFLLTGMAFGLLNNPRFSKGINDMGDSVVNVGAQAVDLGRGLSSNVTCIFLLQLLLFIIIHIPFYSFDVYKILLSLSPSQLMD